MPFLNGKKTNLFFSGVSLALSSMARSFTFLLSFFWTFILPRRKAAVFFLSFLIIVGPWLLRCYLKSGKFVPISSAGAEVFFRGNSPFSSGGRMLSLPSSKKAFRKMGYNPDSPLDVIKYNLKHPDNIIRLLPKKIYWLYWADPKRYLDFPGHYIGFSYLLLKSHTPFSEAGKFFIWAFALYGIFLVLQRKERLWWPVVLTLVYHMMSFLAFLGQPRYGAPVFFIIYALALRGMRK